MKYLYLHGLGQTSTSWDNVIKETEVADDSISLSLNDMKHATYEELYLVRDYRYLLAIAL